MLQYDLLSQLQIHLSHQGARHVCQELWEWRTQWIDLKDDSEKLRLESIFFWNDKHLFPHKLVPDKFFFNERFPSTGRYTVFQANSEGEMVWMEFIHPNRGGMTWGFQFFFFDFETF